jgi:catechol 2,3-dioxygenase-like lactoylglutathione lyase family enzyme
VYAAWRLVASSPVIRAVHLLVYSDDAVATRAFLRDVLGWPFVEEPNAPGWLIFKTGSSELGVHPTHSTHEGTSYDYPPHHSISITCDDLARTMTELEAKGAGFAGPVQEEDWGLTVMMRVPGVDDLMLYEPRHPTAYDL